MVGSLAISQTANELVLETTSKHEAAPGGMGMQKTQMIWPSNSSNAPPT